MKGVKKMNWKIFPLTKEEASIDICTGYAYAVLNKGRWINSTYGSYSPEGHNAVDIENFVINDIVYTPLKSYFNETEGFALWVVKPVNGSKENTEYIIKNLRKYGISIAGVTDQPTDTKDKYIQQQRLFRDIYEKTHKDGNNIGTEGNKSTKKE